MVNLDATSSATTASMGGTEATSSSPSSSQLSQPNANAMSGNPNASKSGGSSGDQGNTGSGNDPQGLDPDANPLEMIVFTHRISGGRIEQWGIRRRLTATEMVQMVGLVSPIGQTNCWSSTAFPS